MGSLNRQIIAPRSIAVIGGSNDLRKPGGKLVRNLIDGGFSGRLTVVNPGQSSVQGLPTVACLDDLDEVELGILAIPADQCPAAVEVLIERKGARAFIVISAGFGEVDEAGAALEARMRNAVDAVGGCLIGPNCIGVLNGHYSGVFTTPIPELSPDGCDLVSSSGATAVFIMEAGIPLGLKFANVFSVGNGAQISVEDVLQFLDESYEPGVSAPVKILYMESISDARKFLRHASSLVRKGCHLAAIKAGATDAGIRAAASHTGALASSDRGTRALFRKAGVVYCSSREELITVASVFHYRALTGPNVAIITHAGGSAVMLADALSRSGLSVPAIDGPVAEELRARLHPGSSVANPIDFLATGTADQLGVIVDYCEHSFDQIDAMVVVFGSPGLFDVEDVYRVLSAKLDECRKPIFPVLPSVINAHREIQYFLSLGHINFPDEVVLGTALGEIFHTPKPASSVEVDSLPLDHRRIRSILQRSDAGFVPSEDAFAVLDVAGIPVPPVRVAADVDDAVCAADSLGYPVAIKVSGPVHKSDVGGVSLNLQDGRAVRGEAERLLEIAGADGLVVQPMFRGTELLVGAVRDPRLGPMIMVGMGGILVEILDDVQAALLPLDRVEVSGMLRRLKGFRLLQGVRGQEGVDERTICDVVLRVASLIEQFPEICELEINPLMGCGLDVVAVDARIRVSSRLSAPIGIDEPTVHTMGG